MIYLVPLIFSVPLSYGISTLIGDGKIAYIYPIVILVAYLFGAFYKKMVGSIKNIFNINILMGSLIFSLIFFFMIFITSPKNEIGLITFLTIFSGSIYFGFIVFVILTKNLDGFSFSGFAKLINKYWHELLAVRLVDYLGLCLPIFLMISYLLLENIGVYGDDAYNLLSVRNAIFWTAHGPNLLYSIKVWYLFDLNYPPLFFLLSTPFLKFFHDWVVGARVYVLLIGVLDVILIYYFLKRHVSTIASLVGTVLLVGCFSFISASRAYGHEIILITFLLLLLILMDHFSETGDRSYLLVVGIVIALGMLSKYNYFIYAVVPTLFYLGLAYFRRPENRKVFNDLVLLTLPTLLFASPWYIYTYITHPGVSNVLKEFINQKTIGRYESSVSLSMAFTEIWQQRNVYFSDIVYVLFACLALAFLIIYVIKIIRKQKKWDDLAELLIMPVVFILIVTLFLKFIGLILLRWNLSYIFIPVIAAYMFDRIFINRPMVKIIIGVALYTFLIVFFMNVAIRQTPGRNLFQLDVTTQNLLPNPLTTGAKEAVVIIKNNWLQNDNALNNPITVGFIGHIHAGLHGHALAYYGTAMGFTNWRESNVGILNGFKPTDLSVFFNTDYLIYIPNNQYNYEQSAFPKTLARYQWIIENALVSFTRCTKELGTIESRFGQVVVLIIDHSCFTPETYFDLINVGRQFDSDQPSFQVFWDVETLRYKLMFNLLSNSQKEQSCGKIKESIIGEKEILSAFYLDMIQNNLAQLCMVP